jgi:3-oxoacyl-[acyl-carrier protein] reductase
VNAVAPGLIETAMTPNSPDQAARKGFLDGIALGRPGTPDDVAGVVTFLAPMPPVTSPVKRSWSTAAT